MSEQFQLLCEGCGITTPQTKKGSAYETEEVRDDLEDTYYGEIQWTYHLVECDICHKVALFVGSIDVGDGNLFQVYPFTLPLDYVPREIAKAMTSAKLLRASHSTVYMAMARKVIELTCKDRGAEGRTLEAKIDNLSERGVFPQHIKEMAHIVREHGNRTMHEGEVQYTLSDAEQVHGLITAILEFLYINPQNQRMAAAITPKK